MGGRSDHRHQRNPQAKELDRNTGATVSARRGIRSISRQDALRFNSIRFSDGATNLRELAGAQQYTE